MTHPFYNAKLAPGMIANYGLAAVRIMNPGATEVPLWEWLDTTFTGPFAYSGSTTAHWQEHIQVSNETDRALLLERFPAAELFTEGHHGYPNSKLQYGVIPQTVATVEDFVANHQWNLDVYFGEAGRAQLREFLKQFPIPIQPASTMARAIRSDGEKRTYLRQRNKFWVMLIHEYQHRVRLCRRVDTEMEKWCTDNCMGAFAVVNNFDNIGMFDIPNYQSVTAFEDETDAAKFKLFWAE